MYERLQRSKLGPFVRTAVSIASWPRWKRNGSNPPAPPHVKRAVVAGYAQRFKPSAFVETGTYRGDTVARLRRLVPQVVSIELAPTLANDARKRFAKYPSVEVKQGDSAVLLPDVVKLLTEPSLFWLDGHFSGGSTADSGESPIMKELDAVLATDLHHVILIDDARLFDGSDGYPTLATVTEFVASRRPELKCTVQDDIIRVHD